MTNPVAGALPGVREGQPPLVQLLTPEGERVEHPDYSHRRWAPRSSRPLPRPGARPPRRRRGHRAAAPGRARPLGQPARARRPRRSAPAGRWPPQDYVFPTYREHGVAWCRGVRPAQPARPVPRGRPRRLGPDEHNFHLYTIVIGAQTLHATGYAMGIQRDGAVGTGDPGRDAAVIAYFGDGATSQGDVNEAFVFAACSTRRSCSSARTTSGPSREPNERQTRIPLYQRAAGLRLPRRPGRRQRRARRATPSPGRRSTAPAAARARRSSRPSPTGWARTPPPTTRPATASRPRSRSGSEATRSTGSRRTWPATGWPTTTSSPRSRPRPTSSRRTCAHGCLAMPDPGRWSMFDHVYAEEHPLVDEERAWFEDYHRAFVPSRRGRRWRGHREDARAAARTMTLAKAHQRTACAGAWSDDPKVLADGRGHRQARRRLPRHRRAAEGLRRGPRDRHPAGRVRHLGTAIGLALRGYRPVCEIQFDGFVYPAFDQIVTQLAKMHSRSAGTVHVAGRHPHARSAAASARSSTTASRPRPTSRTPRACGWSPARTRRTPTG